MATDFNRYATKGNELLNMLSEDLKIPRSKAGRILRAVLHTLRDHLTIEESIQMMAQLPVALKGVYVDQWDLKRKSPRIHHVKQFLDEVRKRDTGLPGYDFGNDESAEKAVKAVFRTLNYFLSDGEFEDMVAVLPGEIKEFVRGSIGHGRMVL